MPKFRTNQLELEARQFQALTTEDQLIIATWCNGRLRGMALHPADRIIQIDLDGEEIEIKLHDWIVRTGPSRFLRFTPVDFFLLFEHIQEPR